MRRFAILPPLLLLAACGGEPPQEQEGGAVPGREARADEPDFAGIEPITFPDIEEHDLFGAGCSFIGLEEVGETLFVAMEDGGYFKTGGKVVKLAPDAKSAELPHLAREVYSGEIYWAQIKVKGAGAPRGGGELIDFDGELTLRDGEGAILYASQGVVECGA